MSNRKKFPQNGRQAAQHRLAQGRHRQPPRPVTYLAGEPGQVGARFLAVGALGSAAMAAFTVGAAPTASLASTAIGATPAVSLAADILPPPVIYYKAPPAPGTPAPVPLPVPRPAGAPGPVGTVPLPVPRPADAPGPVGTVPLPVPRPADAPGPVATEPSPAPPQDQFGAGAQPFQTFDITPAPPPQPQQGRSFGAGFNLYPPTGGWGGGVSAAANANGMSVAFSLGLGIGADAKFSAGPPPAMGFQAGLFTQAPIPGGKMTLASPTVNCDSDGNCTFPGLGATSLTPQINLPGSLQYSQTFKPFGGGTGSSVGPDFTTALVDGGSANALSVKTYSVGSVLAEGAYVRVGFSWTTLANMISEAGKAQYSMDTGGRSFDEDFAPTPQEIINQDFTSFPNAQTQVGQISVSSPAPGVQPTPYLSVGNSAGPVDPITGAPASYGEPSGGGGLPSWVVPGLIPAPTDPTAPQPSGSPNPNSPDPAAPGAQPPSGNGSSGTGKQGSADPASGTAVAADTPAANTSTDVASSGNEAVGSDTGTTGASTATAVGTATAATAAGTATADGAATTDNTVTADGAAPAASAATTDNTVTAASAAPADNAATTATGDSSQMVAMADPTAPTSLGG